MDSQKQYKTTITLHRGGFTMMDALGQELTSEFGERPLDKVEPVVESFDSFSFQAASIAVDILVGLGVSVTYDLIKNKVLSVIGRLRKRKEVNHPLEVTFDANNIRVAATIHDNKAVTFATWERADETQPWQQKEVLYPYGEPDDSGAIQRAEAQKVEDEKSRAHFRALMDAAFVARDPAALKEFETIAMDIVPQLIAQYKDRGISEAELREVAQQAIQIALDKYQPDTGFAFHTYVKWRMQGAITKKIAESGHDRGTEERQL